MENKKKEKKSSKSKEDSNGRGCVLYFLVTEFISWIYMVVFDGFDKANKTYLYNLKMTFKWLMLFAAIGCAIAAIVSFFDEYQSSEKDSDEKKENDTIDSESESNNNDDDTK